MARGQAGFRAAPLRVYVYALLGFVARVSFFFISVWAIFTEASFVQYPGLRGVGGGAPGAALVGSAQRGLGTSQVSLFQLLLVLVLVRMGNWNDVVLQLVLQGRPARVSQP